MTIGGKEVKEIWVLTRDNELIASITDENVITKNGYDTYCVPFEEKKSEKTEKKSDISTKRVQRKAPIPVH